MLTDEQQEFWELLHLKREVEEYGTIRWRKNNPLHREHGPAAIYANGTEEWYQNGELHRDDGPAVINADGTEEWFKNGKQVAPF